MNPTLPPTHALRLELGMSTAQFAKLMSCDKRSVKVWEFGIILPNQATLKITTGLLEAMKLGPRTKELVKEYCHSASCIGGLAYLIIKLFDSVPKEKI